MESRQMQRDGKQVNFTNKSNYTYNFCLYTVFCLYLIQRTPASNAWTFLCAYMERTQHNKHTQLFI